MNTRFGLGMLATVMCATFSGGHVPIAAAQSFSDVRIPYVQFRNEPQQPLIAFQQGRAEEDGRKADTGELWTRLALQPGRSPMIILMHGCGGMNNGPTQDWIKAWGAFFWKKGYSVMAIDSFTTRGVKATCGTPDDHWAYRRRDDAYSALQYLAAQGRTDMNNVVVMGRSNGGRAVIRILEQKMRNIRPNKFARGFAMYPFCGADIKTRFYAPIHIFIGADDDANPAKHCEALAASGDPNVRLNVFPETFHGFDDGSKQRTEYGWRLGGNAKATEQVRQLIDVDLGSR